MLKAPGARSWKARKCVPAVPAVPRACCGGALALQTLLCTACVHPACSGVMLSSEESDVARMSMSACHDQTKMLLRMRAS